MRPHVLLALLLLTTSLAGCIGADDAVDQQATDASDAPSTSMVERANVPALPAELAEIREFEATADDGTALRGHVYLPDGEGPFATVLLYYPYWNSGGGYPASDGLATEEDGRETLFAFHGLQALMDAGFAIAAVNIRGTGLSEGCFSYMNMPADGPDANAVVRALAEEPWSNGKVGMYGISYGGAVQDAALAHDPPEALNATVIVSGETDVWNLLGRWGAAASTYHHYNRDLAQGVGVFTFLGAPLTYRPTPESLCPETVEHGLGYDELKTTGDKNEHFQARSLLDGISTSHVPTFVTNGLTDGEGHILQFEGLWDAIQHEDKRLLVGQWPHHFPFEDAVTFTEEHAVGWFDRYLRDGPPVETRVVTYEDDTGTLHNASAWPPAEATLEPLFLSDGTLVTDPDAVAPSEQRFVTMDDQTPYPTSCPGVAAVYVSPPLAEDVLLAGNVFVNVTLTSTQPDENIAAYLWTGDDTVPCVNSSGDLEEHRHAMSDLYHRGHLEQGSPFPVGEPGVMEMRTVPLAEVLPAGERLMLAIGAGHPWLVPTGGEAVLTAHTGPDVLGELWVPVVEGELVFEDGEAAEGAVGVAS